MVARIITYFFSALQRARDNIDRGGGGVQTSPTPRPSPTAKKGRNVATIFHKCQLLVFGTDSENVSDCLSDQGHSVVTYGQISFETATLMPRKSGRSPRGGDRHGTNHTSSRSLCVELSELTSSIPIWVMGRAAAITSSVFLSGELGEIHFCIAVLQAISGMATSMVTYGRFLSKRLCSCRTQQAEALGEAPFLSPSLPPTLPVFLRPRPCLP